MSVLYKVWVVYLTSILVGDNFHGIFGQKVCLFGSDPECHFPCHCGNDTHPEPCDPVTGKMNSNMTIFQFHTWYVFNTINSSKILIPLHNIES